MKADILLYFLSLLAVVFGVRAYLKLKQQNKLVLIQSQEIKKQLGELEHSNRQLQELFQERQQLIGIVSHDLKGPFNRIFALIQLMKMSSDNLTAEQQEYLGKMHHIATDGLSMVRNLLDNRKLESKGIELSKERLNISTLINSLLKSYHPLFGNKQIKIEFESKEVFIQADKMYLSRVIENLLSNALKFSPSGKSIYISILQKDAMVEVRIQDEGPGITAEDQKRLFQKFQTLSAKPTGGESSTGLGLSIVKAILDKMGAEIKYINESGKGATFAIYLPVD